MIATRENSNIRTSAIVPAGKNDYDNNYLTGEINTSTSLVTETLVDLRNEIDKLNAVSLKNVILEFESELLEQFKRNPSSW